MGLITLDVVKNHLDLAGQTALDTVLTQLVEQASAMIELYCDRRFASQSYDPDTTPEFSIFDGDGNSFLMMPQYPVTEISAIEINDVVQDKELFTLEPRYRNILNYGSTDAQVYSILIDGYVGTFAKGYGNVKISYTAGFATIPSDLQQACCMLVSFLFNQKGKEGMTHEGDTVSKVARDWSQADMPSTVKAIISKYVKVEVAG